MSKYIHLLIVLITCTTIHTALAQINRWKVKDTASIQWVIADRLPHDDHMEMSGKYISAVVRYGVNSEKSFVVSRDIVWPMLRTLPNDTHASLVRSFDLNPVSLLTVNKQLLRSETVSEIELNGKIIVRSNFHESLQLERTFFPSTDRPVYCEKYELTNVGEKAITVEIPEIHIASETNSTDGVEGSYILRQQSKNTGVFLLPPKSKHRFYVIFSAAKKGAAKEEVDVEKELEKRNAFLSLINNNLILETPDSVLNTAFALAKIRSAESIYQTKGGPMHSPGGIVFYAAIWANDQGEYINPFFPYLGYDYANESALNSYRHFARFMNDQYNPIPSSIIAEGIDVWKGAGDRGDAAMLAYGASRFCMSMGSKAIAEELWPLIEWCLEYNRRKLNTKGVVSSDSDELENRFPSGDANLCTSSLYYDALISASYLGGAIGKDKKKLNAYITQAKVLRSNIDTFFGANMAGFPTYRYYDGNEKLRSWICMPLTVNIFDRKEATINALFSPELWTVNGLASQAGDKTFWDRSTLYAFRGVFAAGETKRGLSYLKQYTKQRFLGEHVPYPIEAYPEGNQRQLSAESALYCRIYTEGLLGIRPVSLHRFILQPQMPEGWNFMNLKRIHAFQNLFDISITRLAKGKLSVRVTSSAFAPIVVVVNEGESTTINLPFSHKESIGK